jgi:hypothetical protein
MLDMQSDQNLIDGGFWQLPMWKATLMNRQQVHPFKFVLRLHS